MVDTVGRRSLTVEQTLHGYGDGHRLLASSLKLPVQDARVMLKLSDLSGPTAITPADGYLTGYPLHREARYVLARTWAAPEMPRPGCVWTHSLLIDFADLAILESSYDLLSLFRRPCEFDFDTYSAAKTVWLTPAHAWRIDAKRASGVLNALYSTPQARVLLKREEFGHDEALVLAVWMQQWPRLRRRFRFSTFSIADRSTAEDIFDLQVMDANRLRTRSSELVDAVSGSVNHELAPALDDLITGGRTDFRGFLRQVGGDIEGGRAAMVQLCRFFAAVREPKRGLGDAVSVLDQLGPNQGRAARSAVVNQALTHIEVLDQRSFDFLIDEVRHGRAKLPVGSQTRLGRELWRRSPRLLIEELDSPSELGAAASAALNELPAVMLVEGLMGAPGAASLLFHHRPEIAAIPEFWSNSALDLSALLTEIDSEGPHARAALKGIVASGRVDMARSVAHNFSILRLIEALSSENIATITRWLEAVRFDTEGLAHALAHGASVSKRVLLAIARLVDPDAIPNAVGDDPWAIAWSRSKGTLRAEEDAFLAAYFVSRGLGFRSRSPDKLLQMSFERAHQHLSLNAMPEDGWRLIEVRFGWLIPWWDWDRCARLREAVVHRFVKDDLDPVLFGRLAEKGRLFARMTEIAAESGRGRRYLARVRKGLKGDTRKSMRDRAKYIEKVVD